MKVHELMSTPAVSVRTDTPIRRILELLDEHRISAVPVVDEAGTVLGVVSEGDLIAKGHRGESAALPSRKTRRGAVTYERSARAGVAGEVMTSPAITVEHEGDLRVAARLMSRHEIGRLPVTAHGSLMGVLSRSDVLRAFLRADEEIDREIRDVVESKLVGSCEGLQLTVKDGVVTLDGCLEARSTAQTLAFHVDRIIGVIRVDNRLTFRLDDLDRHTV